MRYYVTPDSQGSEHDISDQRFRILAFTESPEYHCVIRYLLNSPFRLPHTGLASCGCTSSSALKSLEINVQEPLSVCLRLCRQAITS